ncbi:MAG: hypothetical protein FJY75_11905 [Candidatus Eisenbacteria bacterium]|uniref:Uncharacterized protein n=1 Tax=Eiseniibacteriota bacterium TaxID=2212470 RepID=A0A937XAK0_UNCEI|nr:hypothetical protein [Candidatus Eisenbacteria bacterium]
MAWYEPLLAIDRRVLYALMFLAVLIPTLLPIGLPIRITPEVQNVYDRIDGLRPGEIVFYALEYDPSTAAELEPMAMAMLRHAFSKDLRVLACCLSSTGVTLVEDEIARVAREYDREYGRDYVYLGYQPYPGIVIMTMGENFRTPFPLDYYKTPLDELPMMRGVRNYDDVALVFTVNATSGIDHWITYGQGRYKFPLGLGSAAVMATNYYQYVQSGQLFGIISGLRGAAEYEMLIDKGTVARKGMDVQSIAHALIVLFILFGNIAFLVERRRRRLGRAD